MIKKDKTIKSDKVIKSELYAKTFLKAFGIGFVSGVTDVKSIAAIAIGSAVLNSDDIAKGELKTTLKTAGLVNIGSGVLRGVVCGVMNTKYIKDDIAQVSDDISEFDVKFEKED